MKYIITFGSGQLSSFNVAPSDVSLVIDAESEVEARIKASQIEGVGNRFCSSYPYSTASEKFKKEYGMTEYNLNTIDIFKHFIKK